MPKLAPLTAIDGEVGRSRWSRLFFAALLALPPSCSDPPPMPSPLDPLSLVDPEETYPPWELWADVREMVGAAAFDGATRDWLPGRAAEALAAAGPPDQEERLYGALWRLGLERDALLAALESAGTPREFPLADSHPPRHWRVLLEHWFRDGSAVPRSVRYSQAFAEAWGGDPAVQLADPRLIERFLSAHPEYPVLYPEWDTVPWRCGGGDRVVWIDVPFVLTAQQPDEFGHIEVGSVLWLLEQGAPPAAFDLIALEELTRARLAELQSGTVPTIHVDVARLRHERARRLVDHYID